jgi:hypothetical protein
MFECEDLCNVVVLQKYGFEFGRPF